MLKMHQTNKCIQIETNIKYINKIKEKIKKFNKKNINIKFCKFLDEEKINDDFIFGDIVHKKPKSKYFFRDCPINMEENKKYEIICINQNIVTKIGKDAWTRILCENKLSKGKLNCWKISVRSTLDNNILVGIASNENDIKAPYYYNGYFACLCCGKLFSGAPHNYKNKIINIDLSYEKEIVLIMNMKKKNFKDFI